MTILTSSQHDILKEVATIGLGNAITPISKLLNQKVDFCVPNVALTSIETVQSVIGIPQEKVVAIVVNISKDLNGVMLFVLSSSDAKKISEKISDLQEMVNIFCGSCLTALSKLLGYHLDQSVPASATDMCRAVINQVVAGLGGQSDNLLVLNTILSLQEDNISARLVIIFEPISAQKILTILDNGPKNND